MLERFLQRPHDRITELSALIGDRTFKIADFSHLPAHARFIAMTPQWEFLNFLAQEGAKFPQFHLKMSSEATDLIKESGHVIGVRTLTPDGEAAFAADLAIAADGRNSTVRGRAGLSVRDLGAPIDVLWMRLPRLPGDANAPLGNIGAGYVFVMIERGEYFQCGYITPKGGYDAVRAQGLAALRERIAEIAPIMKHRVAALKRWSDVKLLSVRVDRLERWWKPGLVCIGDAAHAMSPVGGVGINLAVADAVAAANILAAPLARGAPAEADLAAIQARRLPPTRAMQAIQLFIQNRVLSQALSSVRPLKAPLAVRLLDKIALLRRLPALVAGLGLRPEHVRTIDAHAS